MRKAISEKNWPLAAEFADGVLISHPDDPDAISDVARVKALNGDKRSAALLSVEAAVVSGFESKKRIEFAIAALVQVGELYEAVELMDRYLEVHPEDSSIRRTLVGFLGEAERYDLIPKHMKRLIQDRAFDAPLLVVTTENSARRFSRENASILIERNPDDLRITLASGRQKLVDGDYPAAQELLSRIVQRHKSFAPAHAMLGQTLIATGASDQQLADWFANTPAKSREFADYWLTVADIASEAGELSAAARGYWEATKRNPNNSTAWSRLVRDVELLRIKESQQVVTETELEDMRQRIANLLKLRRQFYDFSGGGRTSQTDAALVAATLLDLGRYWEAEAWSAVADSLTEDPFDDLKELRARILKRLSVERDWIGPKHSPALLADLSDLPLPSIKTLRQASVKRHALIPAIGLHQHIRFRNEAEDWGLGSVGADNNPLGIYLSIIRTTGTGAGAVDFDLDGCSDLLVVGAGGSLAQQDSKPNVLIRNLRDRFADQTESAGIIDTSYGQGVVVGDYNEDGFADLLFANLGNNRLFRNNGDGTFGECVDCFSDTGGFQWSTSGAFADLDDNGIADLVVSNYCRLDDQLEGTDPASKEDTLSSHALDFPSQADNVWLANGDGTYRDLSEQWMQETSFGRGLAVLCGQFSDGRFGVFIANDMSVNNYFELPIQLAPTSAQSSSIPLDSAAARGLAVNAQTLNQASMGIAQCDFDGDGDLDFYVTGFAREHNILYEQIAPGLWQDRTHTEKLVQPTHMMTAFGTEAIDMDNDGIEEIIVTNGGIGDEQTSGSTPYQQPLQIFRRSIDGVFQEVIDDDWDSYFAQDHVGRTLLSADFDRDGRVDALVTHNYEPVALLMNRSKQRNHFVRFRLVGTDSSRDAVGAIVRFRAGGRLRTLWSVSGDGYMCSNERILHAGLGDQSSVQDLTVTWRDGSVQQFGDVPADKNYLLVQGQDETFVLH